MNFEVQEIAPFSCYQTRMDDDRAPHRSSASPTEAPSATPASLLPPSLAVCHWRMRDTKHRANIEHLQVFGQMGSGGTGDDRPAPAEISVVLPTNPSLIVFGTPPPRQESRSRY
jgi:hypothetical protein